MYRSKDAGRNTYCLYEDIMNRRVIDKLDMERKLRDAIDYQQFNMYYQPIIDLNDRKIHGVEALVRWEHPELGLILPSKFISLAEETGLIIPLGRWILNTACNQCALWSKTGFDLLNVAVNISGHQFKYDNIVETVRETLRSSGLKPERLEIEITESILIDSKATIMKKASALKALGISLVMDDFGTGYSSLNYIRRFPFDKIKIDRSFIEHLNTNQNDAALTRTIILLAKSLDMYVTAEGVDKPEQIEFLKKHHCDQAQGFLFSPPLPADEFLHWMKNYKSGF